MLQEETPQPHPTKATLTMPRRKHDTTFALVISLTINGGVEAACLLMLANMPLAGIDPV